MTAQQHEDKDSRQAARRGSGKEGASDQPDVRGIVLSILIEHEQEGTFSNELIRSAQDRNASLSHSQRSFLKRLAEGTIERQIELDEVIRRHLKDPEMKLKTMIRCLLRMSIYQIYYMDSVPDFAACSEAVRLCRKRHADSQAGFVNAVLRSVCRDKEAVSKGKVSGLGAPEGASRPHVVINDGAQVPARGGGPQSSDAGRKDGALWSMPEEILTLWRDQLGEERTHTLCEAMMEIRPVCIRLSPSLTREEREQVLEDLKGRGVLLTPGRWAENCFLMRRASLVTELPGFAEGKWTVQDESSQLVADAAGMAGRNKDLAADALIFDVCAAPGGKTMLAAGYMPGGRVLAYDLTREKTDRIRAGARRMKLGNVTVSENDASNPWEEALKGSADLVLCDVPCSGLGVMTRKRDIKYNVTMQKIRSLAALQKRIAVNAAQLVKPGGVLLYTTCTINRIENEKAADYLVRNTNLVPEDLVPYLPEDLPGTEGNCVQLFPDVHGTDGFFMARFRKPAL